MNTIMLAVAVLTACAIVGCSTYSKVSEKRPLYQPLADATGAVTKAQAEIVEALRHESQLIASIALSSCFMRPRRVWIDKLSAFVSDSMLHLCILRCPLLVAVIAVLVLASAGFADA